MTPCSPSSNNVCYHLCETDPAPAEESQALVPAAGPLTAHSRTLADMPVDVGTHILKFYPDAARALGVVSRTLHGMSTCFLTALAQESGALCAPERSTLYSLVHDCFAFYQPHFASHSGSAPIRFLLYVPAVIGMMQVPDCPPNVILSTPEIAQFNQRIADENWRKIWPVFHAGFTGADLGLEGVPAIDAPVKDIRHCMFVNQHLLQCVESLSLANMKLTCAPMAIRMCTGLQSLSLHGNALHILPRNLFQGLSGLKHLGLSLNGLRSLPVGIFNGLSALQCLHLASNDLATLPEGIFQGLTGLQELYLANNGLRFFPEKFLQDLPQLHMLSLSYNTDLMHATNRKMDSVDIFNHLEMFQTFFSYACESPLAQFYQCVARNPNRGAVQQAFSKLSLYLRLDILKFAWKEANRPSPPHPFDDMPEFCRALKKYATKSFDSVDEEQSKALRGHLCALALKKSSNEALNFLHAKYARLHAEDNILRLIDAIMRLQQGESV